LHYNLNRYYDPNAGRFIHQDPISLEGGANVYRYTQDPVNWIDPFGLTGKDCSSSTTRLWRAVEPEELADVKKYGDYNIHPNSTFKRFAFDEASVDEFIKANPEREYTKTFIDVPTEKLGEMYQHVDPEGGSHRY